MIPWVTALGVMIHDAFRDALGEGMWHRFLGRVNVLGLAV